MALFNAQQRFDFLHKALDGRKTQDSTAFREYLLSAYDCEDGQKLGKWSSEEVARIEKEFALRCLNGIGPDENEATFDQGNLCTVLAKEIGTLKEDHKMIPWLGGDWVSMARLIIHNADIALAGADATEKPERIEEARDLIRVWPVKEIKDETKLLPYQRTTRICLVIGGSFGTEEEIYLQTSGHKFLDYRWVILPQPPGKLHTVSKKDTGLARNLWQGRDWDPGEDQGK